MEKYLYTRKNKNTNGYNIWIAFPGIYSFSMFSLGLLWTFQSEDTIENTNVERICTDTKETQIPFNKVDLIGFSFSFDLDFLNIFKLMEKYSIPLKSSARDESY